MNEIDLSYFDLLSYQEHLLSGPVCTYKTSHNLSQALLSTRIWTVQNKWKSIARNSTTELMGRILYFYGPLTSSRTVATGVHYELWTDELILIIPTQIKHVHNTPAQYHSMSLKFATMVHEYRVFSSANYSTNTRDMIIVLWPTYYHYYSELQIH